MSKVLRCSHKATLEGQELAGREDVVRTARCGQLAGSRQCSRIPNATCSTWTPEAHATPAMNRTWSSGGQDGGLPTPHAGVEGECGTDHGSGLGTYRWVVEQTSALLHWFRRLCIRFDASIISWRRLQRSFR